MLFQKKSHIFAPTIRKTKTFPIKMKTKSILAIIGGICRDSLNKRLYNELVNVNETDLRFSTFDISGLPFYSQDLESDLPEIVADFRQAVAAADALLLITPEYNRSFPGVLKNALDWGSRPYGKGIWAHKPAAIAGASSGKIGTFGAQQHLRNVCSFLDMNVMRQPEFYFDASASIIDGKLTDSATAFLKKFLASFEKMIMELELSKKSV
jgi:chromate reductase